MHFKFKNTVVKQQSSTTALMDRTGVWSGSTVDWSDEAAAQGITIQEYSALKRKHGTSNVNLTRAGMVKAEKAPTTATAPRLSLRLFRPALALNPCIA